VRPNILCIISDDQGCWAMGCAGNPEIRTPNLDRLAASGIRMENLFCVTPVCSAARASILTGTVPSAHGVHDYLACDSKDVERGAVEFLAGQTGYTDLLARGGYECGHVGKWHMGILSYPQKGYGFWRPKTGAYMDCGFFDESGRETVAGGYVTDRITDFALEFLEGRRDGEAPWYLNVCYNAPHSPWEREHHWGELWDEYYEHCAFESCPYPPIHAWDAGLTDFWVHPRRRREKLAGYFAAITRMDEGVGRLLDRLEASGERERTLVVFTSDNGMNMGHHGICGKGNGTQPLNLYDTSVKVPGIVSMPGTVPAGVVSEALVSHYDFFPTFLEMAGIENTEAGRLPGRSFAGLLRSGRPGPEGSVVVYDEYGYARMIRTRDWKYVHRFPDGPHELYDLREDPGEERNVAGEAGQSGRVRAMREDLDGWFERYAVAELDGRTLGVTGCGQKGLATAPDAFLQAWPPAWLAHREEMRRRYEGG
jgi:arylsulfatase A-like enzyme